MGSCSLRPMIFIGGDGEIYAYRRNHQRQSPRRRGLTMRQES